MGFPTWCVPLRRLQVDYQGDSNDDDDDDVGE